MKAIILAAGVGKRLWSFTQHRPKCLIEVGGKTLLARYLEALISVGIGQAVLVVGYKQDMIRDALRIDAHGMDIRCVVNEDYHRGSISSLWEVRGELTDDVLIMDADVLFHREILTRLAKSSHPNALCVDETVSQQNEECMAVIRGGRVVSLSKHVPEEYDFAGEGVGFLKVHKGDLGSLIESVKSHVGKGSWDMEYEDALADFFTQVKVGYEKIGGLPWIEIDFPEDLARAEREVLPKLD